MLKSQETSHRPRLLLDAQFAFTKFACQPHTLSLQHTPHGSLLAFPAGRIIRLLGRTEEKWWEGELDGERGWFPSNLVVAASPTETLDLEQYTSKQPFINQVIRLLQMTDEWKELKLDKNLGRHPNTPVLEIPASTSDKHHGHISTNAQLLTPWWSAKRNCERQHLNKDYPPLMTPLLRSILRFQNAIRKENAVDFRYLTACIVSCVRSLLYWQTMPHHRRHTLFKQIDLQNAYTQLEIHLNHLTTKAKRASNLGTIGASWGYPDLRDILLYLAHQVFVSTRSFLTIALDEYGLYFPEEHFPEPPGTYRVWTTYSLDEFPLPLESGSSDSLPRLSDFERIPVPSLEAIVEEDEARQEIMRMKMGMEENENYSAFAAALAMRTSLDSSVSSVSRTTWTDYGSVYFARRLTVSSLGISFNNTQEAEVTEYIEMH